jgi:serine/threonine protein kinase/Tfp pilus assembly protein PilF
MNTATPLAELAFQVDAFEDALATNPDADLAAYLPEKDALHYADVLAELVRVDLEHAWGRNRRRRLADYRRFPAVFENVEVLRAVAFEEYRLRRRAGDSVTASEYANLYSIDTADWDAISESAASDDDYVRPHDSSDGPGTQRAPVNAIDPLATAKALADDGDGPPTAQVHVAGTNHIKADLSSLNIDDDIVSQWDTAAKSLPEAGTTFLGFKLVEELGKGAFGRVFLAHQDDLASRPVALKVACDIVGESQTLAQLQHTNIVPIYSFHRVGRMQAVCMPYFGRTTLAQVLQRVIGLPQLPSSGRELKSTLKLHAQSTINSAPSSQPVSALSAPSSVAEPAPVAAAPEPPPAAADGWARVEGLSYVEAVLWLGEQIADGLAHAHDRGIVHRDLKPANVLLTDDGRAMLLDFNLAEDVKQRGTVERASVGGTLPYMAPEHMEAFRGAKLTLDGRCDIFGLGVMLFELLTGKHPFPVRRWKQRETVQLMIEDRRQPPPTLRDRNPAVSPATEAIVRKCLEPDRENRYQKAEHLLEDLHRQLAGLPLKYAPNPSFTERVRKWVRRHPRVASSGTVGAVAALLLSVVGAGAVYSRERAQNLSARTQFADHQTAFADAQLFLDDRNQSRPHLDESLTRLQGVLARYGVRDDGQGDEWLNAAAVERLPDADRDRLRGDVGEVFFLMADVAALEAFGETPESEERARLLDIAERWHAAAERHAADRIPFALKGQRAGFDQLRGKPTEQEKVDAVELGKLDSARDLYLLGNRLHQKGEHRRALPFLQKSTQIDPSNFSAWFVRGNVHRALGQHELAAMCFSSCVAIRDEFAPAWLNRGLAFSNLRFFDQAVADYDRAVRIDPNLVEAYILRAYAKDAMYDPRGAEADFGKAIDTGSAPVRVYFLRADVRDRLGDKAGAKADREAGLRLKPDDELSWVGRAEMRQATDPVGALADVEEALKLNPFSVFALQLKSHILAELLKRPDDAVAVLDRAVTFHPDNPEVRAGRGVVLARLGKRDLAVRDAQDALRSNTRAPNLYQVGCIYAQTAKVEPGDKAEAIHLLWSALKTGFGMDWVDTDTDLDPLRKDPEFKRMVESAKALHAERKR